MKSKKQQRCWLPNYSELIDRLSIHQLKEVFIPGQKEKYRREMKDICHDLDVVIQELDAVLSAEMIRTIIIIAQINAHIWYNEAKARLGEEQDLKLLRLTHGLNGIRSAAGNQLLRLVKDETRMDYKTDCLAAEHSQWEIALNLKGTK